MCRVRCGRLMISAVLIGALLFCTEPAAAWNVTGEGYDRRIHTAGMEEECFVVRSPTAPFNTVGVFYGVQLGVCAPAFVCFLK